MAKGLQLGAPSGGYPRLMAFNRSAIERLDDIILMHFGLVNKSGMLLDRYSCAITVFELDAQKESLMEYLGRTGALGEAPQTWQPPNEAKQTDFCNFIGVASSPAIGEITLNNFVGRAAAEMASQQKVLVAQPVALLKSGLDLHRHWIRMLFQE
jgi:hypothetical protein